MLACQQLVLVQDAFRKGRGTRDQIANICWIIEKAREFQKNIYFFTDYAKAFDCGAQETVENPSRNGNTRTPYLSPEKVMKQQLELDLEHQTSSK